MLASAITGEASSGTSHCSASTQRPVSISAQQAAPGAVRNAAAAVPSIAARTAGPSRRNACSGSSISIAPAPMAAARPVSAGADGSGVARIAARTSSSGLINARGKRAG